MLPLRIGVLGCGKVFEKFHLPAIQRLDTLQLVAAHDVDLARLAPLARLPDPPQLFETADALIHSGNSDAVLVLTPPAYHADAVVQALEAGLHVLVEKPMALEVSQGRRMVQAAAAAGRRLQVGFSRRFREPYQRVRALLSGIERPGIRGGLFELSFPTQAWSPVSQFLGNDAKGGGPFDDVLSHQVDLVGWLLGQPQAVRARAGTQAGVEAELRIRDVIIRCVARQARYVERLELWLHDDTVLQVSGGGMTRHGARSRWRRQRAMLQDRMALLADRIRSRPNVSLGSFLRQLEDFERSVRSGAAGVGATGEDGLRAIEIVQSCRVSAENRGTWLSLTPSAAPAA